MSTPRDELALAVVLWDGASEDGCSFCQGEWRGGDKPEPEPFILHEEDCPVVAHRLELIEALIDTDPVPDTAEGKRLSELTKAQERYERARFPFPREPRRTEPEEGT